MDIFRAVGTVEQTEQPNYLAEGQTPFLSRAQKRVCFCIFIEYISDHSGAQFVERVGKPNGSSLLACTLPAHQGRTNLGACIRGLRSWLGLARFRLYLAQHGTLQGLSSKAVSCLVFHKPAYAVATRLAGILLSRASLCGSRHTSASLACSGRSAGTHAADHLPALFFPPVHYTLQQRLLAPRL
eukprot:1151579-Pelagomonas_calceolata.AAC.1